MIDSSERPKSIQIACVHCGSKREVARRYALNKNTCSRQCYQAEKWLREKSKRPGVVCKYCKGTFRPVEKGKKREFCKTACRTAWFKTSEGRAFWAAYRAAWVLKNPAKIAERNRKAKELGTHRKYYWEHRERCLEIATNSGYRKRYGLTSGEVVVMRESQEGLCAICAKPPKKNALHVDHCHITGKVRALLCVKCNSGLAYLENEEFCTAARRYLAKHSEKSSGLDMIRSLRLLKLMEYTPAEFQGAYTDEMLKNKNARTS